MFSLGARLQRDGNNLKDAFHWRVPPHRGPSSSRPLLHPMVSHLTEITSDFSCEEYSAVKALRHSRRELHKSTYITAIHHTMG